MLDISDSTYKLFIVQKYKKLADFLFSFGESLLKLTELRCDDFSYIFSKAYKSNTVDVRAYVVFFIYKSKQEMLFCSLISKAS